MYKRVSGTLHLLILVLLVILLGTCASSIYFINDESGVIPAAPFTPVPMLSVTAVATYTPSPVSKISPTSDTVPVPDTTDWSLLQPGLDGV